MKIKQKDGHLVVEIEIDISLLQEKLNLLSELKSCFSQAFSSDFFCDALITAANDENIILYDFRYSNSEKLLCSVDLDMGKFIKKWIIAMKR